jgi:hypothetical protein
MKTRFAIFFAIGLTLSFVSFSSFSSTTEQTFVSRFKLVKKNGYYLPSSKTNAILLKKDEEGNPGKIYKIKAEKLNNSGLVLFYIQRDTCQACSVELWLFNEHKRPSVVQLIKFAGNSGNPPSLLEFIPRGKNAYFLFRHTNMAQGIEESTLDLLKYNIEVPSSSSVFRSFLSDKSFLGATEKCSGWSTTYKIDLELGRITFLKSGHYCKSGWLEAEDKSRNGGKVFKEDTYIFEQE